MQIVVNKHALKELLNKLLRENRSFHSANIDEIPAKEDETPIQPTPQMAVQLSVDRPPVDDETFVPTSTEELSRSASVISDEVPSAQIEYFYRLLHQILDKAIDREISRNQGFEEQEIEDIESEEGDIMQTDQSLLANPEEEKMNEALRKFISNILSEAGEARFPTQGDTPVALAARDAIEHFNTPAFKKNLIDAHFLDILDPGSGMKYPFRIGYTKDISKVQEIVDRLIRIAPGNNIKSIIALGKDSNDYKELHTELVEYVLSFLKDPSSVTKGDIMIGDANKIVDEIRKGVESNDGTPDDFLEAVNNKIKTLQDKELALTVKLLGIKTYGYMVSGETSEEEVYDETEVSPGFEAEEEEEEIVAEPRQTDADAWTQIAREEGFASAAGARQYAFKPMIKMLLQSNSISGDAMDAIISKAAMSFRNEISNLEKKGLISADQANKLKRSAQIGPEVMGNETFRIYFSIIFYQPFINDFLNKWRMYAHGILSNMGIQDPKMTITKMLIGETSPNSKGNQKKIQAAMSKQDFNKALEQARQFSNQRDMISNYALKFATSRLDQPPKVKNAIKKALSESGAQ